MADALLLERDGVLDGQLWRLWSGHLLHLDALHAAINITALAVLMHIAARMRQLGPLLVSSLWMMPLLSASLLLLSPGLQWYAGLSGLLHACAAWLLLRHGGVAMWTGLALLAAKLAWEQLSPAAAETSAFPVIHLAHLIGAGVGLALAWPQRLRSLGVRRS
ncbi:rhombosortase [Xanthomonas sp. XNM01]|nr:rhombosortase [Xanthomonas sp. XNM01]